MTIYLQESYTWHPLETCKPLLDKTKYATFNKAKTDEAEISQEDIRRVLSIILINEKFQFVPLWVRELPDSRLRNLLMMCFRHEKSGQTRVYAQSSRR